MLCTFQVVYLCQGQHISLNHKALLGYHSRLWPLQQVEVMIVNQVILLIKWLELLIMITIQITKVLYLKAAAINLISYIPITLQINYHNMWPLTIWAMPIKWIYAMVFTMISLIMDTLLLLVIQIVFTMEDFLLSIFSYLHWIENIKEFFRVSFYFIFLKNYLTYHYLHLFIKVTMI